MSVISVLVWGQDFCLSFGGYKLQYYSYTVDTIMYHIPIEQVGFRLGRCTTKEKRKLQLYLFVDLTAAFDTVWKDGLLFELLMNNMLSSRCFTVSIGNAKSLSRTLSNRLPQVSVLASTFFKLSISDVQSQKFGYADDWAIAPSGKSTENTVHVLTDARLEEFLGRGELTWIRTKQVCCFHLDTKIAHSHLQVYADNLTRGKRQQYPKIPGNDAR